jgi:hypothetical protein
VVTEEETIASAIRDAVLQAEHGHVRHWHELQSWEQEGWRRGAFAAQRVIDERCEQRPPQNARAIIAALDRLAERMAG